MRVVAHSRSRRTFVVAILALGPIFLAAASEPQRIEKQAQTFFPESDEIGELEGTVPAAALFRGEEILGYVFLTDDIVKIPAYSGETITTLVGIDTQGQIVGVEILRHSEPILVTGVSEQDLAAYVDQYRGTNVKDTVQIGGTAREGRVAIDGLSGATITAMVLNASITRAARIVAASRGIPFPDSGPASSPQPPSVEETLVQPEKETEPLWIAVWRERTVRIAVLAAGLLLLTVILVFQDWLTQHASLVPYVRTAFLVYTLFFIGWYGLAQLSVINVLTFVNSMMRGFQWETFLIDPMMFILWSFVAITLLLWGRGVYCGWLCPFGALQELTNKICQRLNVPQIEIPTVVHERLWAIKYMILLALFALSLQSMLDAVLYAEVEPFKTAINMRFDREWPFVLYAAAFVAISAFNSKFFCKYVCPLGAALTFPARFRIFEWLRRRRDCGRPCQVCAVECPSQAIRPTGEINSNECHYCLDCQVTYWNAYKCPPLVEKRKRLAKHGRALKLKVNA